LLGRLNFLFSIFYIFLFGELRNHLLRNSKKDFIAHHTYLDEEGAAERVDRAGEIRKTISRIEYSVWQKNGRNLKSLSASLSTSKTVFNVKPFGIFETVPFVFQPFKGSFLEDIV
jgi:hypothetical protein